jgi:hypothetical protein
MKRRVVIVTAVLATLVGGGSTAAQAIGANSTTAAGYWGCVGVRAADKAICVKNPLPEELPAPPVVSLPAPSIPAPPA